MLKLGNVFRPARTAGPAKTSRPSRTLTAKAYRKHGRTIPWRHAAIYGTLVVAAGLALGLWDHAYEARQAALLAPPPPEVLAKNLVENIVGPGSVHTVSADPKAGTLDMTVEDVLVKPGQSRADEQKNLTTEGALAIQLLQSRLPGYKSITIHLVKSGKPLATVKVGSGKTAPTTEFAPEIR